MRILVYFAFQLVTLKSPTSVTVSVERTLNQNFVSEYRPDFEMFLIVEIPCFVHGQIYRNFLKPRTMSYPYYNTMKLRAERLFVEINVNTIYGCFLADAPRRTRHLLCRLKGSSPERAGAQALRSRI